ncbi:MAG: hypothetical protein LBR10_08100 [Prevotellaceae bacterium]|jgi:ABC-type polysaccharide/polyol phosphate export permease|nr:hypothetical protein [Prevotellaceae bacterium]
MKTRKNAVNKRAIVSVAMLFAFTVLIVSAIFDVLNLFADDIFKLIHAITGILFMILGIFHIVYNWRTLMHYLKGRK